MVSDAGHPGGKTGSSFIPVVLSFVSANHTEKPVPVKEIDDSLETSRAPTKISLSPCMIAIGTGTYP